MIAGLILGAVIGLCVGWWVARRWYAAQLRLATEQCSRLQKLQAETSSLSARYQAMLEEQKTLASSVETSIPCSPVTNTTRNVKAEIFSHQTPKPSKIDLTSH